MMDEVRQMVWVETLKAVRSRLPLWTGIGSMLMPLGVGFLLFAARNPEISQKLGLVSAKANLVAYAATDWPAYLSLMGQMVAMGGFLVFTFVISWVFGREFVDGTLKDLWAVPVGRNSILLAKFLVTAGWCAGLSALMLAVGMLLGGLIGLEGLTGAVLIRGGLTIAAAAGLMILNILPSAWLASLGRGYLLPIGVAGLCLLATNIAIVAGWGDVFPFAVPGLLAQGKTALGWAGYASVGVVALTGAAATTLWWTYADQSR